MDDIKQIDASLAFMFKSELLYAGWLRNPTTQKIHGVRLVYADGSELVLNAADPIWIDVLDNSKAIPSTKPDLADKGGQ